MRNGSLPLLNLIGVCVRSGREVLEVCVPSSDGALLAWLYRRGDVLERHDDADCHHLKVALADKDMLRFRSGHAVGRKTKRH